MSKLGNKLGKKLCSALPGFHSFTGCDFTSSLMRKGKVRPLTVLENNPMFIEAFSQIGEHIDLPQNLVEELQAFVCAIYGRPILKSVNEARFVVFQQSFAPKGGSEPLAKIKGTDPSHLPPCYNVLLQKISRANYVAFI